jgi:hypothetical protein
MRINDLISEERIDEKPMGFLSKLGNKALSAVGNDTAKGKLESGEEANKLKKEFQVFLGKSRQKPEPEVVLDFLKKRGYPTAGAEAEMQKVTTSQKVGQAVGTGAKLAGQGAKAVGKAVAKGAKAVGNVAKDIGAGAAAGAKQVKQRQDIAKKGAEQQKQANPNQAQLQLNSVQWDKEALLEALSSGQLDAVFLRAVGDKYARDDGGADAQGQPQAKPQGVQKGGAPGFIAGLKKGMGMDDGNAPAPSTTDTPQQPTRGASGAVIPKAIEDQINKLSKLQRQELLRML